MVATPGPGAPPKLDSFLSEVAPSRTLGSPRATEAHVGGVQLRAAVAAPPRAASRSISSGESEGRGTSTRGVPRQHAGVSVNDLTDPLALDALSGNAALNGVPVRVEAL
jgi:hypothetical protein